MTRAQHLTLCPKNKDTGITITSLMPGPTETNFFHRADMKGKSRIVEGSAKTKVQEAANKVLPDKAKAALHRSMAEPGSGEQ